ncbi:MAG: TniQ family protein [Azonexus sp.]
MILSRHLPDETLGSLLARIGRLNGFFDLRDVVAECFDQPRSPSFIDARVDVPGFCERISYVYGVPATFLENLTWLPAQTRLGELDVSATKAVELGEVLPTVGELTFPDETQLSLCRRCVEEDIEHFGTTYWHRIHQFAVVQNCPHHRSSRLIRIKVNRAALHHTFPLPGDYCANDEIESQQDGETSAWRDIGSIALKVMGDERDSCSSDHIRWTLGQAIRKRKDVLAETDYCGETANRMLLRRIVRDLPDSRPKIAMGRLLLVYLYFGSWQAFRENVYWTAVLGSQEEKPAATSVVLVAPEDFRAHHRKVCEAYIREHPGCSRLEFTKAEYRSFRWLLHNDKEWLDSQLAVPVRGSAQLALF